MSIEEIYPPYVYSIHYDGNDYNEFDRLFCQWNDVSYIFSFMEENLSYLKADVWSRVPAPEDATRQVLEEAETLEKLFEQLYQNTTEGIIPDFDSHFQYLDGKYKYELVQPPMKSYGPNSPSLLRMYAIKMEDNVYLITGGGIKLADTIQNSPGLKDHVLQNIDRVKRYLKEEGIIDSEDMEE